MLDIGVMVNNLEPDRLKAFARAVQCGFRQVHTSGIPEAWLSGPERDQYIAAARTSGVAIAAMFIGFDGQSYADIPSIARTVGLAVAPLREHRSRVARQGSDLARELGVVAVAMHLGFLPPDATDPSYRSLVESARGLADYCGRHGQTLLLETGQEAAHVLLRFIRDVDRANLAVNFDPANFVLYGSDDPIAALKMLAPLVRGLHCKDGLRPRQAGQLGREVRLGQGEVPFPALMRKLLGLGYGGPWIIERERGPHVVDDILHARIYLESMAAQIQPRQAALN